jgi:HSP20 family protein
MSLIKRNPQREVDLWRSDFPISRGLERMQREMNRVFDEFFRDETYPDGSLFNRSWSPAVDIEESSDAYVLKAELPGMKKDDVKITLDKNLLTLKGEKSSETERKDGNFYRMERSYGSFERSFVLPGSVKADRIDAAYQDGVLTLTLPKTEEAKQKLIEVKVK